MYKAVEPDQGPALLFEYPTRTANTNTFAHIEEYLE